MAAKSAKKYDPIPLDTSDVQLALELRKLTEVLAENVHDNWARERLDKGWVYGPLDRENRTHPGLQPYSELSEEEKEIDRRIAIQTLKFIIKQGYMIVPQSQDASNASKNGHEST